MATPGRRIAHGEEPVGDRESVSQARKVGDLSRLVSRDALIAGGGRAAPAGDALPSVHLRHAILNVHGGQLRLDGVLDIRNGIRIYRRRYHDAVGEGYRCWHAAVWTAAGMGIAPGSEHVVEAVVFHVDDDDVLDRRTHGSLDVRCPGHAEGGMRAWA